MHYSTTFFFVIRYQILQNGKLYKGFPNFKTLFIKTMDEFKSVITGHLDILAFQEEEESDGVKTSWNEVLIHGDPEGLRSLANLLLKIADLDQEQITDLPVGAREHLHLRPGFELSDNSATVIAGRLDAKGTGAFYDRYIPKKVK